MFENKNGKNELVTEYIHSFVYIYIYMMKFTICIYIYIINSIIVSDLTKSAITLYIYDYVCIYISTVKLLLFHEENPKMTT